MNDKMKKLLHSAAKLLLFVMAFLMIYSATRDVLRNKQGGQALSVIANKPDHYYDVILAGPSHMQWALQPAQLFGEYGIVSCNTATSAQSIPTTYYVVKELIDRHEPELVVVDLFCLFTNEVFFTPTRFHQAIDHFPLSVNKLEAVYDLVEKDRPEFLLNYMLYHGRWKELTKDDYLTHIDFHETYQIQGGTEPFPAPFVPVASDDAAEVPEVALDYLKRIVDLCKETDTELLLTVIPYRADVDNNDTSAILQQQMYNTVEKLAREWDVDFFNGLRYLDEIGFDFMTDMLEYSHVNASGAKKLSTYYGQYILDHYQIPDRSEDKAYADWYADYQEYSEELENAIQKYSIDVNGWFHQNGAWYYYTNGSMVTGWQLADGNWYYLGDNGAMVTGWLQLGANRYYLNSSGIMVTGTHTIDGESYTFSNTGILVE